MVNAPTANVQADVPSFAGSIVRARDLSARQWAALAHAACLVSAASVAVAITPFRRAVYFGSVPIGRTSKPNSLATILWAVGAASRRLPLRTKCIEQGIAVQRLLRQSGVDARLHYGARHEPVEQQLQAHVWVTVNGQAVIGGECAGDYAEIASYP